MARYAKEHKAETRKLILKAARKSLQTRGIEGTAIPALMGEAGLTHGGFYAHFGSKTALLAEVCGMALRRRIGLLEASALRGSPGEELAAFIDDYLSIEHLDNRATGCILPALAGEISRQESQVRRSLTESVEEYMQRIAALMPGDNDAEQQASAMVLASGMAGALMLARTVDDRAMSERILSSAREFYKSSFRTDDGRPMTDDRRSFDC